MSGAIPPLPQYTFMALWLLKAQGQLHPTFSNVKRGTACNVNKPVHMLKTSKKIGKCEPV
jgi:hypothetical protein